MLVQLSGPGYQGDPWIPAMVAEAGFRYPVAMTATAFCRYVSPLEGDDEKLAPCQDIQGRLWDVLWMLKVAIRHIQAHRQRRANRRRPRSSRRTPRCRDRRRSTQMSPSIWSEEFLTPLAPAAFQLIRPFACNIVTWLIVGPGLAITLKVPVLLELTPSSSSPESGTCGWPPTNLQSSRSNRGRRRAH